MKKALSILVIGVLLCTAGLMAYKRSKYNAASSCANCRTQLGMSMRMYASDHGNWYPRGGTDEWDSLARCIASPEAARASTSHALGGAAARFWTTNHTLSAHVCCYRYNEGLRAEDPVEMVLLYYKEPTRWASNMARLDKLGRPVMDPSGHWEFLNEPEFQRRHAQTIQFLAARRIVQQRETNIVAQLKLVVRVEQRLPRVYVMPLFLVNTGPHAIRVTVTDDILVTAVTTTVTVRRQRLCTLIYQTEPSIRDVEIPAGGQTQFAELSLNPKMTNSITNESSTRDPKMTNSITNESSIRARCWLNTIQSPKKEESVSIDSAKATFGE